MANATGATPTVKAVILIGGPSRGTRFRPLSFKVPKPLFPVAGEPVIEHHIEACAKVAGLKEVILIGFYEPSLFEAFITAAEARFNVPIKYLREYKALGTGGGLYHFRDQILAGKPDHLIVIHSDVYADLRVQEALTAHRQNTHARSTIIGKRMNRDQVKGLGCLVSNASNEVLHYAEKPETFVSDIINCGIYIFNPSVFELLADAFTRNQTRDADATDDRDGDVIRLEQDVLGRLAGSGTLFVHLTEGAWGQIKSAGSALPCNAMYLEMLRATEPGRLASASSFAVDGKQPTFLGANYVHPTARIHPTAKIGPNASIGPHVVIGAGVRVKQSILLSSVQVKDHACVLNSIIGWSSVIGEWTRVEGGDAGSTDQTFPLRGPKQDIVTIFGEDVFVEKEVIVRNCVVLPHKELKGSFRNEIIM